jgi:hypothetical protein
MSMMHINMSIYYVIRKRHARFGATPYLNPLKLLNPQPAGVLVLFASGWTGKESRHFRSPRTDAENKYTVPSFIRCSFPNDLTTLNA